MVALRNRNVEMILISFFILLFSISEGQHCGLKAVVILKIPFVYLNRVCAEALNTSFVL